MEVIFAVLIGLVAAVGGVAVITGKNDKVSIGNAANYIFLAPILFLVFRTVELNTFYVKAFFVGYFGGVAYVFFEEWSEKNRRRAKKAKREAIAKENEAKIQQSAAKPAWLDNSETKPKPAKPIQPKTPPLRFKTDLGSYDAPANINAKAINDYMAGSYVIDGFKHWSEEASSIFPKNSVAFNLVGYKNGQRVMAIEYRAEDAKIAVERSQEEHIAEFAHLRKDVDEVRWEM